MDRDLEFFVRLSRREVIRCGLYGAAGLMLSHGLAGKVLASSFQATTPRITGKANAVIQVWLWGGPAHLDTFDPKPGAGPDFTGPFATPIKTNVDGLMLNELLVELAKIADKYSIIRSLTHGVNAHETAAYIVQTGHKPGDGLVHPSVGAVVSFMKAAGYKGLIPPYVVLSQLLGRFSETGFLGSKAPAFATGGDPNHARFLVEGVIAEGVSDQRQRDRRLLLREMDALRSAIPNDPRMRELIAAEDAAYDLILGDAGKVFDLTQENDAMRQRYGKTTFGQSCLVARRLVERGVPFVAINSPGWDTHKQHFPAMRRKLPDLDQGLAALISDLAERGLLDSTIVWCSGEFGRTPRVQNESPWNGGRGHYGPVFSGLVAGGGFKGGQVVGSSDARGEEVRERPVYPCDMVNAIYELMGIGLTATLPHPQGRQIPISLAHWDSSKSGGRLSEIL